MFTIMVAGSAAGYTPEQEEAAAIVGRDIARAGCVVVSGATSGLPEIAVNTALAEGGRHIGFSPARNYDEHLEGFGMPKYEFGQLRFQGTLGRQLWHAVARERELLGWPTIAPLLDSPLRAFLLKFRNVASVGVSDAIVAVGGRVGTINELTNAADMGKPIGVVAGVGGNGEKFLEMLSASGKQKAPTFTGTSEEVVWEIVRYLTSQGGGIKS